MAKKVGKIYVVEWEDSAAPRTVWMDHDEEPDVLMCTTVGFLAKMSKDRVVMASSLTPYQMAGVMSIPRSAVRSMKRL